MNPEIDLTFFTKINSKWTRALNVKCKTIKLLEDNVEENLGKLAYGDDCLDITPIAHTIKEINWTPLKLKTSLWMTMSRE